MSLASSIRLAAFLLLFSAATAGAESIVGEARVELHGTSSLHEFDGHAPAVRVQLQPSGAHWAGSVALPVTSLSTDNSLRDSRMYSLLRSEQFPEIRARFGDIDPEAVRRSRQLSFELSIAGVEQRVVSRLSEWTEEADGLRFVSEFDVSLKQFQLEAPTVLFVTVSDTIRIRVAVELKRG